MKITRYVAFEPRILFSSKGPSIWKFGFFWGAGLACLNWTSRRPMFTWDSILFSVGLGCIWVCVLTLVNCFTVDDEKERQDKLEQKLEAERKYHALMSQKPYMIGSLQADKAEREARHAAIARDSEKLP